MDITVTLCIYVILLFGVHMSDGEIDLGALDCCTALPRICQFNEICKGYCKDACSEIDDCPIYGTGVYADFSPVCKSAVHDLRISVWNSSEQTFLLKRTARTDNRRNTYYGSFRNRIMSSSVKFSSSYEFFNPHISENILDVISIHKNYLFEEGGNHIQECFVSSKWLNLKFYAYNEKYNVQQVANPTYSDEFKRIKVIWPGKISKLLLKNEKSGPNAGFQCIPVNNTLSILTSLAFRKDAYFLPSYLTLTVNINESVTLNMLETKLQKETETIWRKDGVELKDLFIVPQNVNHTSITLENTEIGFSGIYSLEYKKYNLQRRGYVRLLVRACSEGKYGTFCNKECPKCLNGGLCHDITGTCICAPGFNGSNCEKACEVGFVGRYCSVQCNLDSDTNDHTCEGLLICSPDPYGCSCAAGFFGTFCNETCPPGTYGAGCHQKRVCHCAHEKGCDIYSGICKGKCAEGWYGKYCNETPISVNNLSYNQISPSAVNLTWQPPSGSFIPVQYYIIAYKQVEWGTLCPIPVNEITEINVAETHILLENLMPFSIYSMNVSVVTVNVGPPLEINLQTPATKPPPPSGLKVFYRTTSSLFLSWEDPFPSNGFIDSYEISYRLKENSTFIKIGNINSKTTCDYQIALNCFVMKKLMRNQPYEIQLKAFNANISESSEPVTIKTRTYSTEPESNIKILVFEQKDQQAVLLIYSLFKKSAANRSYYLIVDSTDKNHESSDFDQYIYTKSNCDYPNSNTFIAGKLNSIPINFTIGNGSCFNGYYNSPLKSKETYRFGLLPIISDCKETTYGPIIFTARIRITPRIKSNGDSSSFFSAKSVRISLGLLLPFTVILLIGVLYMYLKKSQTFDTLIPIKRYFREKAKSDLAVCNDGLDDFDVIETESISEDISNCMPVKELPSYIEHNVKNNKIRKEFMSVPKGQIYPCSTAKLAENKFKNRYGNILPYDHSRVILKENGDSEYIHANYVDGYKKVRKYIATQGPMPLTIQDFWSMVWQEKVSKIIMITNLEENGKIKCEKYWSDEVVTYGSIDLSLTFSENYADYLIRTFSLSKDHKSREVKQFHFTSWPDHGIPLNTTPFLNFLKKVEVNANFDEPIIVHCSAGIGRTGAVILFENSFDMGVQEGKVDILGQLCSMRKQRMNIVETYEQYMFILHALVEALCIEKTSMCPITFLKEYDQIFVPDSDTGNTTIEKQFQMLKDLPSLPFQVDVISAYMANNQPKNRSMHILPSERARPILETRGIYTDYINAVYIDGYNSKNKFIATQYPLPETVIDFWRMVFEVKSKIIVLLQDIPFSDAKNSQLWASDGIQVFDMLEVEYESVDEDDDVVITNVIIKHKEVMKDHPVKVIQVRHWSVDDNLPPDTSALLSAMKFIQQCSNDFTNHTIITVCLDGMTACGVFCSFLYIVDRLKSEKEIDIFQTTKCIRTNRPQFIPNMEQYRFLFALTKSYLESVE